MIPSFLPSLHPFIRRLLPNVNTASPVDGYPMELELELEMMMMIMDFYVAESLINFKFRT